MTQRLTIGHFAKITGLSARALRIYDREGLLHPAYTDPDTGYRYYTLAQAQLAERVRLLRSVDVPLNDIRNAIQRADSSVLPQVLVQHQVRIEEKLACYQEALRVLSNFAERDISAYQVNLKEVPAARVISRQEAFSLATIEHVRGRAFGMLYGQLEQLAVEPAGPGFSADIEGTAASIEYHEASELNPDAECGQINLCVPVPASFDALPTRAWPAGRVAFVSHTGPYEPLHLVYKRILTCVADMGLSPQGVTREIYHVGPSDTQDRNAFKTEVQVYVEGVL